MARPLRIEFPGAYYHVTSRGNESKVVYRSRRDREQFLSYLESATERYGAVIHAYCLMDNHYHLLIETPLGNLSRIMQHINSAYTLYFNVKRKRSGHLFQGRYKAILVEADEYAKALSRYIHFNPVRAKILENPSDYAWSSCRYFTIEAKAPRWLNRDFILGYFCDDRNTAMQRYLKFLTAGDGCEGISPLKERLHAVILGTQAFVEDIKEKYLNQKEPDRDLPALNDQPLPISIGDIDNAVDEVFDKDKRLARQVKLYLSHRYTGLKLKEIGRWYGIGESGVTQASSRMQTRIDKDRKLRRTVLKAKQFVNV
jgi:putative transposase